MKSFAFLLLCLAPRLFGQSAIPPAPIFPEVPDEKVLAIFDDGARFTMGQLRGLFPALPPNAQQAALKNRKEWIHQFALMRRLARMAEQEKLDLVSPTREALEYGRLTLLMFAQVNAIANTITVDGEDIRKAYEARREDFKQVKLKVIYVSFISDALLKSGAAKGATEEQARVKAESLARQIRQGADFVKLVKAHSEDRDSREKDGEFQTLRRSDNIPEAIRSAVFALKPGEITEPVRQPAGFYIFQAGEVTYRPLAEVRDEIYEQLRVQAHQLWMKKQSEATQVQLVDQDFFNPPAAASVPPLRPPGKKQ